jgi:hypothetical protein
MAEELVTVAITVRGSDGLGLEAASSVLVIDTWPQGGEMHATGYRPSFSIPRSSLGNGGYMTVTCDGYETRTSRIITPFEPDTQGLRVENAASLQETTAAAAFAVMDQEFICQVEVPVPSLLPVHVDGQWFRTSDGAPWSQYGCSDFRAFQRFIAGEDIEPVLAERAAIGFNQLRVFLMCDWMFKLRPQDHPDYFEQLGKFLDRLAAHGLRAELTVLVDATVVMPNTSEQQQFFRDVCATVANRPHIFVELVNENDQTINVIDADAFTQPDGIICSHGSKGVVDSAVEPVCVPPLWTYGTLHPARPDDWPRLGGHNTMEDVANQFGKPGTDNESCRPDQGRGPIPSDWFDAAANIALLCAGGTFHSHCGKDSRLFDATERSCADAWMAGARAVPLSYQRGQYIAGHLHGFPINWAEGDSSRAHGRLIGSHACLSLPQMREGYVPTARPGWRIVKQTGSVVEVEGKSTRASELHDEAVRDESAKRTENRP